MTTSRSGSILLFVCLLVFYQQVAVTAVANTRAAHPLQVDMGALCLDVAEASLQGTLLGEQRLQPGGNTQHLSNAGQQQQQAGLLFVYLTEY